MDLWFLLQGSLILAVLFVNGWTDAPNAIASAVGSGAFSMKKGVLLAAGMNLLGGALSLLMGKTVANTVSALGAFPQGELGIRALCACLAAVVLWAVAAWFFGIPTSESHGLMAALLGASFALGAKEISLLALEKVFLGLLFSVFLGFLGGFAFSKRFQNAKRSPIFWKKGQGAAAALMAFAHGLQDTPKFAALFALSPAQDLSLGATLLCSAIMGLGTLCGGGRIVRKVGSEMVKISPKEGFAADLAGSLSLLLSTLQGMPVSTTHAKTCAMMGASLAGKNGSLDKGVASSLLLAWVLTFPLCAALAFLLTRLFLLF